MEGLEDGEVSPYLCDVVRAGDELELRGPIGGYFVWDASLVGPLLLVSGGSRIVPPRAMLRHWQAGRPPGGGRGVPPPRFRGRRPSPPGASRVDPARPVHRP